MPGFFLFDANIRPTAAMNFASYAHPGNSTEEITMSPASVLMDASNQQVEPLSEMTTGAEDHELKQLNGYTLEGTFGVAAAALHMESLIGKSSSEEEEEEDEEDEEDEDLDEEVPLRRPSDNEKPPMKMRSR
ncbi:MAG TPA: hypothetical protein VL495_06110 [Edaphobacter sp.]|nr:hypothetical protein [Edaphobacter sp.]